MNSTIRKLPVLVCLLCIPAGGALAAQSASGRMYCLSVRVNPGINQFGDTMNMNQTGLPGGEGELAPADSGADFSPLGEFYLSGLGVSELYSGAYWTGLTYLSLPTLADGDNNRFPDFFEVAKPVNNQTSLGSWSLRHPYGWWDSGNMSITWNRSAGSRFGTVSFAFDDPEYWGTFQHQFEILEFKGPVTYTPGSSTVSATVLLTQTGNSASTWAGKMELTKTPGNKFNELALQTTVWTNALTQPYSITNHLFFRDVSWPSNYAGYIEFDDDGSDGSPYPYSTWVLSITDGNDANANGIPDFSDDPQSVQPPRPPQVSLAKAVGSMQLTIRGDIGHPHQVLEAMSLSGPWQTNTTVNLTSDPQTVVLSLPSGTRFYRVTAQ